MTISHACRFCSAPLRHTFVDLGLSPLANSNLRPDQVASEKKFPLIARVCDACFLVQVDDSVPPEDIFTEYDYYSSFSAGWVAHARAYCNEMLSRFGLGDKSFVVEVASNDGYLLKHFVERGIPVLGIEPAANVAAAANKAGVPTEVAFFGEETARRISDRGRKADLMAANNVLAHVPGIRDFVAGFKMLLAPHGVATFEFPHLLNLIDEVQFDTIYHEHFFYLSLVAVEKIMGSAGLRVFDAQQLPTHGGSLRLFVCHDEAPFANADRLAQIKAQEIAHQIDQIASYAGFSARVEQVRASFLSFVKQVQSEDKILAAYGAAAKGNTFLNYCGVVYPTIQAVYDRNPAKQNKLTPGTHIPICSPDVISDLKPDYLLILPWNIVHEVRASMSCIRDWGGRFVTAVPDVKID